MPSSSLQHWFAERAALAKVENAHRSVRGVGEQSMNPYLQIPGLPPGKFRVGQAVRVKHGYRTVTGEGIIGEVVEDRGNIGVGGRRLYGVRIRPDPWNEMILERHEDGLEPVLDGPEAVPPADGKAK